MQHSRQICYACLLLVGLASSFVGGDVYADAPPAELPSGPSFRVETELFEGDSVEPAARHLILFDAGVIYDIRLDNLQTATMYDPTRGRVVLIDRARKQQTVLATTDLLRATAQLRAAAEQAGKADAFGLSATVTAGERAAPTDPETLEIEFGNVQYRTTTWKVSRPEIAHAYHEFATLAAQLNVVRRRGVPPFARMTLGQKIADAGAIPLDMHLEVWSGIKKERYRAHHLVVEQLSDMDRKRIHEIGRVLALCEEIPLEKMAE